MRGWMRMAAPRPRAWEHTRGHVAVALLPWQRGPLHAADVACSRQGTHRPAYSSREGRGREPRQAYVIRSFLPSLHGGYLGLGLGMVTSPGYLLSSRASWKGSRSSGCRRNTASATARATQRTKARPAGAASHFPSRLHLYNRHTSFPSENANGNVLSLSLGLALNISSALDVWNSGGSSLAGPSAQEGQEWSGHRDTLTQCPTYTGRERGACSTGRSIPMLPARFAPGLHLPSQHACGFSNH